MRKLLFVVCLKQTSRDSVRSFFEYKKKKSIFVGGATRAYTAVYLLRSSNHDAGSNEASTSCLVSNPPKKQNVRVHVLVSWQTGGHQTAVETAQAPALNSNTGERPKEERVNPRAFGEVVERGNVSKSPTRRLANQAPLQEKPKTLLYVPRDYGGGWSPARPEAVPNMCHCCCTLLYLYTSV